MTNLAECPVQYPTGTPENHRYAVAQLLSALPISIIPEVPFSVEQKKHQLRVRPLTHGLQRIEFNGVAPLSYDIDRGIYVFEAVHSPGKVISLAGRGIEEIVLFLSPEQRTTF